MPLYCAIDWAGQTHYAVLQDAAGRILHQGGFTHSQAGIQGWLATLEAFRHGQQVAVIYEATKHGLIDVLLDIAWLELLPVAPVKTRMLRRLDGEAGGKSDPRDALLLCSYLQTNYDKLRSGYVEKDTRQRCLQEYVDQEQSLIAQITEYRNRLHAQLRRHCPEWDVLVGDIEHMVYRQFLLLYSPGERVSEKKIRALLNDHNVRSQKAVQRLVDLVKNGRPLGTNRELQALLYEQIRSSVRILSTLFTELHSVTAAIDTLFAGLPQAAIYSSMPGIGPRLAPRLAAVFGSNPAKHFTNKAQVLAFTGQTPLTEQSGKSRSVHKRVSCNRHARYICYLWARSCQMISATGWQRDYLNACRQRGDTVPTRYRKLGAKMLSILYRCLCSGQTYNANIFLQHRHTKPELSALPT